MSLVFSQLLGNILNEQAPFAQIWFASEQGVPPGLSYQVNFSRLELVFGGEYLNQIWDKEQGCKVVSVQPGQALYIPPNGWNKPLWTTDCSVLSLLFGKRQIGFSLVSKRRDEPDFFEVQKHSIMTRTGHVLEHILAALNVQTEEPGCSPTVNHLLQALLASTSQLLAESDVDRPRGADLFHGICIYIQENFHRPITRDSIAHRFNVSSSHLSHLFREQGHMRLVDYISWVRIDRAKFILKKYRFRLEEVATRCGYIDVNYFCRVFKQRTGLTPSQYRSLSQPQGQSDISSGADSL